MDNGGTAMLTNCIVCGNVAGANGGGLNNDGTTRSPASDSPPWEATLTDCTLSGNSAAFGGGLYARSGTVKLIGCTVSGNTGYTGGGMFNTAYGSITAIAAPPRATRPMATPEAGAGSSTELR